MSAQPPPRGSSGPDTLLVVVGVLALGVAVALLWTGLVGPIAPAILKVAAPVALMVLGGLALAVNRGRD